MFRLVACRKATDVERKACTKLLETMRRIALQGTELAQSYVGTIWLKLLKVGAVILRNTRRIRFMLSGACPYQPLFYLVANRLAPG